MFSACPPNGLRGAESSSTGAGCLISNPTAIKSCLDLGLQNNTTKPRSSKTVWPSGLRRWLQAPVRKGVGSNPTAVTVVWKQPLSQMAEAKSVWPGPPCVFFSCSPVVFLGRGRLVGGGGGQKRRGGRARPKKCPPAHPSSPFKRCPKRPILFRPPVFFGAPPSSLLRQRRTACGAPGAPPKPQPGPCFCVPVGATLLPTRSRSDAKGFCATQLPSAAIAQLAARRSHNPKVVSSILTRRMCLLGQGMISWQTRVGAHPIFASLPISTAAKMWKNILSNHIRGSIVVSISACHTEDPGSIPGRGVYSSVWLLARSRACRLQSCTLSELKIPMCRQVPVELSAQQAVPPALATWVSSDTLCTDARAWPRSAQLCTRAACLPAEQHGYPSDSYAAHN